MTLPSGSIAAIRWFWRIDVSDLSNSGSRLGGWAIVLFLVAMSAFPFVGIAMVAVFKPRDLVGMICLAVMATSVLYGFASTIMEVRNDAKSSPGSYSPQSFEMG